MQEKILFKGNFIQFVKRGNWEYAKRHNCQGIVIIVAQTDDKKILFVEQYRPPVGKKVVEFPAGLVGDNHESANAGKTKKKERLQTAAKRELLEETGYRAGRMKVLMKGPVSGGFTSDIVTMVQAFDLVKVHEGGGVEDEEIIIHEIPFKGVYPWLKRMEQKGRLIEPKIYSGLYFLHEYNNDL